jgi:hypothetical protein
MDISVLIPARHEQFLAKTIEDILEHSEANTEVLVGLDGEWADPVIYDHPRVTILHTGVSIGQRAMTNRLASISKAKYVVKTDAHCSFDQGWDRKMLEAFKEVGDNVTMVPTMKNLYAFDWVCECGFRHYQDKGKTCPQCQREMSQDIIWRAKDRPNSTAYKFNPDLEFDYWNRFKARQQGELVESLSLQGSFFMLTREKYWELNICDESWGSWGGQGAEVALKTWLSGGRVIVNTRTWYAHMFRTKQGNGFGFPYPNPGDEQQRAKNALRETFLNNKWEGQKYPLSWLLEKFWPVEGWTEEDKAKLK